MNITEVLAYTEITLVILSVASNSVSFDTLYEYQPNEIQQVLEHLKNQNAITKGNYNYIYNQLENIFTIALCDNFSGYSKKDADFLAGFNKTKTCNV